MSEIKFHLTVHTPWRALDGLLIDIKARFAANDPNAVDALRYFHMSLIFCAFTTFSAVQLGYNIFILYYTFKWIRVNL
jgi:uncharacterized membrane protein YccC